MLTLYLIMPGGQEHSDGHFHLPMGKSSALLRNYFRIQSSDLWLEMSVASAGYLIIKNMTFYYNSLFYN